MNQRKTFIILGVIVLLFLGIFTFAQEGSEEEPKKNGSDDSSQIIDEPTEIVEEKPEEIISNVIPHRTLITPDTIAPVIVLNGDDTIYVDINSTYEEKGAIVTDNRDSDKSATMSGIVNTNKAGKYILTYSGIDASGNAATEVIRIVYVRPLITATSTLDTYEAGDLILPVINATVLYDNEVGEQNLTPDVAFDPTLLGTQTIKFNYNYEGVEANEKTINILVQDTTAPIIQLHGLGNVTLNLGESFVDIDPAITYSDNYDTNEQLTLTMTYTFKALGASSYTEVSEINTTKAGQYYKYYTVTDKNGNANYVSRGITIVDAIDPEVRLLGSGNVTLNLGESFVDIDPAITYSDNYDTNEQLTLTITYMFKALGTSSYTEVSEIDTTKAGQYYKYYTVTDRSGNDYFVSRGITIVDNIPPRGEITYSNATLTNQDVIATLTVNEPIQDLAGWTKTSSLIWTKPIESNATQTIEFYDLAGNKGTASLSIGNIDKEKPVITFSGNNPLRIEWGDITFNPYNAATATDNVDGDITNKLIINTNYDQLISPFIPGTYDINYEVTDSAGNKKTATRTIEVVSWW